MPFSLESVTSAEDIPALAAILTTVFGTIPTHALQYDDPYGPEAITAVSLALERILLHDPDATLLKVADTDTGDICGMTCWHIFDSVQAASASQVLGPTTLVDFDSEEVLLPPSQELARQRQKMKRAIGLEKKCHCYVSLMGVSPQYQGRGIGDMLMTWGTALADHKGLPCYLEAGLPDARFLYQKHGFHVVGEISFDSSRYKKGMEVWKPMAMLRYPVSYKDD